MTAQERHDGGAKPQARLNVDRADIGFSAAHFSIVGGHAERLHGHNYRVILQAHGVVGADGTMVDFGVLKGALREVCAELDERTLLPLRSDRVSVQPDGDDVAVTEGTRRFRFPLSDVCLLPIVNTTCEALAAHLLASLRDLLGTLPVRLEITVEEKPGQSATVFE